MSKSLFCYGTLRSPVVMKALTGLAPKGTQAWLRGYALYRVRGAVYPGIVPEKGGKVEGCLYLGIDDRTLRILDDFEDEAYVRTPVRVVTHRGDRVRADAYCIREECKEVLTQEPWDFDFFLKERLGDFMKRCFPAR